MRRSSPGLSEFEFGLCQISTSPQADFQPISPSDTSPLPFSPWINRSRLYELANDMPSTQAVRPERYVDIARVGSLEDRGRADLLASLRRDTFSQESSKAATASKHISGRGAFRLIGCHPCNTLTRRLLCLLICRLTSTRSFNLRPAPPHVHILRPPSLGLLFQPFHLGRARSLLHCRRRPRPLVRRRGRLCPARLPQPDARGQPPSVPVPCYGQD